MGKGVCDMLRDLSFFEESVELEISEQYILFFVEGRKVSTFFSISSGSIKCIFLGSEGQIEVVNLVQLLKSLVDERLHSFWLEGQ